MKKSIMILTILTILASSAVAEVVPFHNPKTDDRGISIVLSARAYACACELLQALNMDDRGAIGDCKIPFIKQFYVAFE